MQRVQCSGTNCANALKKTRHAESEERNVRNDYHYYPSASGLNAKIKPHTAQINLFIVPFSW